MNLYELYELIVHSYIERLYSVAIKRMDSRVRLRELEVRLCRLSIPKIEM